MFLISDYEIRIKNLKNKILKSLKLFESQLIHLFRSFFTKNFNAFIKCRG